MNRIFFLIAIFILALASCKQQQSFTVAFYNTENLFDTIDAPGKIDEEFTPVEPKLWNTERYQKKISDLTAVIAAIDSVNFSVLVGLCELENEVVLNDLVSNKNISAAGYKYVWHDGPDKRGIDCALLYNPSKFKLTSSEFLPVVNPEDTAFATREIVHATGTMNSETFHVFVNHWPSRRGGEEVSASLRDLAANTLRSKIDELMNNGKTPNIIIMGDLNDAPGDSSVAHVLNAKPNDKVPADNDLVNLMYDEYSRKEGSYSYRGKWDMIDNLIVSGNLINKKEGLRTTLNNGFVFHKPFMEYVSKEGDISPNRTYGRSYFGGISDHFPVFFILNN